MLLDYPFLTHKDDLKDLGVFIFGFGASNFLVL